MKVYLEPGTVVPGKRLFAETVLVSKSETPVDFIEMRLRGTFRSAMGGRYVEDRPVYDRVWRTGSRTLTKGEHRFRVEFPFGEGAPPSYSGTTAWIAYELAVHVSIPWWPDRRTSFVVPVAMPASVPGADPRPTVTVSSAAPRRGEPFMEVALDATDLALGDVVTGSVSLQNLAGHAVRGVDLYFVELETLTGAFANTTEKGRFKLRIHDGPPTPGAAIPFRVRVPERATPSFAAAALRVSTHIEIRADVAWGNDVVVRVPISMSPAQRAEGRELGRVAPVGRERVLLAWQRIARSVGFVLDVEGEAIHGMRGSVRVRIGSQPRGGDPWLVAELGFPSLGLDLDIGTRRWSDALAVDLVKTGDAKVDEKVAVRAREHQQAKAPVLRFAPALVPFEDVEAGDDRAVLAIRGSIHGSGPIGAFVRHVLSAADALDAARALVGPPVVLAPHLPAWRALAESLRGRLELGRMWIHDGRIGTDLVEVGCTWGRRGVLLGLTVHVPFDPPLPATPSSPEDPSVSALAREAWQALSVRAKAVYLDARAIAVELEPTPGEPEAAMPVVELAVALRRAVAGAALGGPFR